MEKNENILEIRFIIFILNIYVYMNHYNVDLFFAMLYLCAIFNKFNPYQHNTCKINNKITPNRVKIIRDFNNLITDNYKNNNIINKEKNTIKISNNKLFSKLQKYIFNKIKNLNNHNYIKYIIYTDLNDNIIDNNINIYELCNLWCIKNYGLI